MGKNRNNSTPTNQPVLDITHMSSSQLNQYIDKIRNMSDDELMKTYSDFTSNWTYVTQWDGSRMRSKFISSSDDILGGDGILRGSGGNLNQQFVNLNAVRLEIGTEMLNRNLDNEYGYSDVPYYEVIGGSIQFHPFTPTNE